MKKRMALILTLCLIGVSGAMAQEAAMDVTANGVVESGSVTQLTAPCSGVLLPFDWESGDVAAAGDTLFEMDTTKIFAPVAGTVRAVFAQSGRQAADVMNEHGMLISIQKENDVIVRCTTSGAYNDAENRRVHAGETVYVEQTSDRDNKGAGRIVSLDDAGYVVELTKGDFDNGDGVKIYREDTMSSKSCIGSGTVDYAQDVTVPGSGYIVACAVREGQTVRQGDLLVELLSQDAESSLRSAQIQAGAAGALEVFASSGMQVYKGQVLAKVHDLSSLRVVASVDEMDLDHVQVGGNVNIVFDRYPNEVVLGTVSEIGSLGQTRQNAAYYDVTIDFYTTLEILPGMNATVTLGK